MRNDLIVLEFYNSDSSEVLLQPHGVAACAESLQDMLNQFVAITSPDSRTGMPPSVEVLLAAFGTGCIRIGFQVIVINANGQRESLLTSMANVAAILGVAFSGLLFAGQQLGYFQPTTPATIPKSIVEVALTEDQLRAPGIRSVIESFVTTSLNAGATNVRIILPEPPTCELVDASGNPMLLASQPGSLDAKHVGNVSGRLTIIGQPIVMKVKGEQRALALGKIRLVRPDQNRRTSQNPTYYEPVVLVDWHSKQHLPSVGKEVEVQGELRRFDKDSIEAIEPITPQHRSVAGVINVTGSLGWW